MNVFTLKKDLACIKVDQNLIPVRWLIIRNVPVLLTKAVLKGHFKKLYGGRVQRIWFQKKHPERGRIPREKRRTKIAVVQFVNAETATAVLCQRKKWANGQRIIAKPRRRQPGTTKKESKRTYSDKSRLWSGLNKDCLIHLSKFLSIKDVVKLTKTSPDLAAFADQYLFHKKHYVTIMLFTRQSRMYKPINPIRSAAFKSRMRLFEPHIESITVKRKAIKPGEQIVDISIRNCSRLRMFPARSEVAMRCHEVTYTSSAKFRLLRTRRTSSKRLTQRRSRALNDKRLISVRTLALVVVKQTSE